MCVCVVWGVKKEEEKWKGCYDVPLSVCVYIFCCNKKIDDAFVLLFTCSSRSVSKRNTAEEMLGSMGFVLSFYFYFSLTGHKNKEMFSSFFKTKWTKFSRSGAGEQKEQKAFKPHLLTFFFFTKKSLSLLLFFSKRKRESHRNEWKGVEWNRKVGVPSLPSKSTTVVYKSLSTSHIFSPFLFDWILFLRREKLHKNLFLQIKSTTWLAQLILRLKNLGLSTHWKRITFIFLVRASKEYLIFESF